MFNFRLTGTALVAACLAGCGSASNAPTVLPAAPQAAQREAKSGDLLYLSDVKTNAVYVYSFPQDRLVATLTGFGQPRSECSDFPGNVWIADVGGYEMIEYPHGGTKPIVAISTPGAPRGCSVSRITGDLAVTSNANGNVLAVYHHGNRGRWRDPQVYGDSSFRTAAFCGYDAHGNLFVDGVDKAGAFVLAELAHGSKTLTKLTVDQKINSPGQVQWDGTYVTVGDSGQAPSTIYQFSISGSNATKAGSTTLAGTTSVRQSWIEGSTIVGPDYGKDVGVWKYPAGGSATQILTHVHGYGAAISLAN
jgi:hypothetical protein